MQRSTLILLRAIPFGRVLRALRALPVRHR